MTDLPEPTLKIKIIAEPNTFEERLVELDKLSQRFSTSITNAFADATVKGKSLSDTLRTLTLRLSEMTLKSAFDPLSKELAGGLTSLMDPSLFNPLFGFARGGAFAGASQLPTPFASGGVIASPVSFPLAGNRTGIAGEAGPEAILPLTRGPDGNLGIRASGASPSLSIVFNVSTPDAESFRKSETQIAAMLARAVAQGQRNL